jgi:hypothetical protein
MQPYRAKISIRAEIAAVICATVLAASTFAAPVHVALAASSDSDTVSFNTSNHKYHSLACTWAKRCTCNCINITRKEAHQRGGIPCKVCGGGEE